MIFETSPNVPCLLLLTDVSVMNFIILGVALILGIVLVVYVAG